MALSDVTVTFNLTQLLGEAFDARRTRAYVKTNVANGTLMDTSTGEIRLGDQKVTIGDDGSGSFTTWAPGVDGNPTSWQTSLVVEYPRTGQRDRQIRTFGPYTITASADLADLEEEQAVPAEYLTQVTDELQTYSDAAEVSATSAAASATSAAASATTAVNAKNQASEIALGDADATLAAAIENPASATYSSLTASIDARVPTASTSAQGKVELATTAEATTGTDTARAVTPAGVKAVADPISAVAVRAARRVAIPATDRAGSAFQTGDGLSDDTLYASPGSPGGTAVVRHLVIASGAAVRLVYTNWYPESPGGATETSGPNDITVRASIEPVNGGTRIPVRVSGKTEFVVPAGGMIVSDPVGIDLKRGNYVWSWTHVVVGAGEKFPRGAYAIGNGASEGHNYTAAGGAAGADVTQSGTRPTTVNEYVYGPAAILLSPLTGDRPTIGVVGDSIAAGTGDSQKGWVERSLEARWSFNKVAYPSEQMTKWIDNNGATKYRRAGFLAAIGTTHILALHGRNDMDLTLATIKSNAVTYWTSLSRQAPTFAQTITPYTTSTDAWATVGNQTPAGTAETNRVNYNDWLRDGAPIDATTRAPVAIGTTSNASRCAIYGPAGVTTAASGPAVHPLVGILEIADLAESARNSGLWKASGGAWTNDGIHPSAIGAAGIQAAGANTMLAAIFGASAT